MAGFTVNLGVSTACVGDGEGEANPVFGAEQRQNVILPNRGDNTHRRITTSFNPVSLSGCSPDDSLFLMISRDGVQDDFSGPVILYGLEFATKKSN